MAAVPSLERTAQRAARAVYGAIIALAVILALEEATAGAGEVIAAAIGSVIAAMLAEGYAEYIAAVIRERRHPTRSEVRETSADVGAGTLAALVPVIPFVLVELGLIELDTAYDIAPWLGLGVIGGYALLANRIAGLSRTRSGIVTAIALAIGLGLILVKGLTH
ncbi:MAG: hypothetical protein ACHQJ5_06390 [Vicinamibacteria bacterium]|jgi:hypothetical protein